MRRLAWVVLLASGLGSAETQTLPRLAVLGFRAQGGVDQKSADLLSELLVADLAAAGKWRVVSSSELATLIGVERQRKVAGCDDSNCMVELAQALGADVLVDGGIGALGNLRVITLRVFDPKKGLVQQRETLQVADDAALVGAVHLLASKLTGLPVAAAPAASNGVRKGWFVVGGGALLAAAGIAFGVAALDQYGQYKVAPANLGLHDQAKTFGFAADGLYAAAIIAGVVGAVMLIFGPGDAR